MTATSLARQILLTIAYTNQFEYPLTPDEIELRLITHTDKVITRKMIEPVLKTLVKSRKLEKIGDYYFLPGNKEHVILREQRAEWSAQKQASVQQMVRLVRLIPWIRGIAVTGSLAMNNANDDSDIDFLFVTQKNRLWLSRVLVTILTWVVGKRRAWDVEKPNSWCCNLWLEEDALKMAEPKHSLYTAYEICQAKWVLDRGGVRLAFCRSNLWVAKYAVSYLMAMIRDAQGTESVNELFTAAPILRWLTRQLLTLLNLLAYGTQKLYMLPHMTRETVDLRQAFFHPRDTQQLVYTRWKHALRQSQKR
jgi:hypothetical protein